MGEMKLIVISVVLGLHMTLANITMEIAPRLIGGSPVPIEEAPYIVQMEVNESDEGFQFKCAAVIIGQKTLLSAGGCLTWDTEAHEIQFRAGSAVRGEGQVHATKHFLRHPEYTDHERYSDFDIAIFVVDPPFEYGAKINRLPLTPFPPRCGMSGFVYGWGSSAGSDRDGQLSAELRKIEVPVIDKQTCKRQHAGINTVPITLNSICAGVPDGSRDTCEGDSGGPYVIHGHLVGLASWGTGCGKKDFSGIYTSIGAFLDWIRQTAPDYTRGGENFLDDDGRRIIGGEDAEIEEAPFAVQMETDLTDDRDATSKDMRFRAGSKKLGEGAIHKVKDFIRHFEYSNKERYADHDLAIFVVDPPFEFGSTIKPIELVEEEPPCGVLGTVFGWGSKNKKEDPTSSVFQTMEVTVLDRDFCKESHEGNKEDPASPVLQKMEVPVLDRDFCQEAHKGENTITDNMLCAGNDRRKLDTCRADSGAPYVINGKLAGLASWGTGCGRYQFAGVYTNVYKYRKFIEVQGATPAAASDIFDWVLQSGKGLMSYYL